MPLSPTTAYIGIFLFIIYLGLLFSAGLMTFRKGRTVLGIVGFIFPPLWLAGALMAPKRKQSKKSEPKKAQTYPASAGASKRNSQPTGAASHSTSQSTSQSKKRKRRHK